MDNPNAPDLSNPDFSSKGMLWFMFVGALVGTYAITQLFAASSPALVTVGSTGFVPTTVSIKKDNYVTWTNNDNKLHKLVADPNIKYPTPGFKTGLLLKPGESYSYNFANQGVYNFHDGLNGGKYKSSVLVH